MQQRYTRQVANISCRLAMSCGPRFAEQLLNRPTPMTPGQRKPETAAPCPASTMPPVQLPPPVLPQMIATVPSHNQAAGRMQQMSQEAHLEFMPMETYERETAILIERVLALKPLLGMCSWVIYLEGRMEQSLPFPCLSVDENTLLRNRLSTALQSTRAALAGLQCISEADSNNLRARAHHMLHLPRVGAHQENNGADMQPSM